MTPDGLKVISASDDNTLKLWNLVTGEELLTLRGHNNRVNGVCVTPDGLKVISASDDKTLEVSDLDVKKEQKFMTLPKRLTQILGLVNTKEPLILRGHNNRVNGVCVTPDGLKAVSASDDNTLKLWNLVTGEELLTFRGHNDSVNGVSLTPDGLKAVSASDDKTLKLWDLKTEKELSTFTGDSPISCCSISPDGLTIVAGDSSGKVHFLCLEGIP